MNELTLESLAKRIEALEKEVRASRETRTQKNWRDAIGALGDNEMMRDIIDEGRKIREADREEGRRLDESAA